MREYPASKTRRRAATNNLVSTSSSKKITMHRRTFLAQIATSGLLARSSASAQEAIPESLHSSLEIIRREHSLPGIAAAAIRGQRLAAEGVAGVRRVGHSEKLQLDDRFGMASCTKRMTAAMICRLIDAGRLSFEITLAEILPNQAMREEYKSVTVANLLTHRAGLPTYLKIADSEPKLLSFRGTAAEKRAQFIQGLLQEDPIAKPGTEANYSNAGYALLGYVAAQQTGKSWETLMTDEVFRPLAMQTAGFGPPRSKDRPQEPSLHQKGENGYAPESEDRINPLAVLAPAGDVHCSIRDFAKFAAYELAAAKGQHTLLRPGTAERFQQLTRPGRAGGGPKMKSGPGGEPGKGKSPKLANKSKAGKPASSTPAFFGGSQFISSGCILWPELNLAAVVAVNGGSAHDAIREAMDHIHELDAESPKQSPK
jgi:CubicO group peptidase (beta-lactamase class C family)